MLTLFSGIAIFIAGYVFGAVSAFIMLGWNRNAKKRGKSKLQPKQLERIFILTIVTVIWGVSNIYAIFNVGYDSPATLHALFGAVVGFYFDVAIFDKFKLLGSKKK